LVDDQQRMTVVEITRGMADGRTMFVE